MRQPAEDVADAFPPWVEALDGLFRRTDAPGDRATEVAELLRSEVPTAQAVGCRLEESVPTIGVWSAVDSDRPRWVERLARPVSEWGTPGDGAIRVSLREGNRPVLAVVEAVTSGGTTWGTLLVASSTDSPAEATAFRRRLAPLARTLGLALRAEAAERQIERLRADQRSLTDMVTVGEAMVSLLHGLNNSLNTMMLQAAVVQLKVDEPVRQEIGLIRREGAAVAARMRPLMQFREQRRQNRAVIDLHRAIQEFLCEPAAAARGLQSRLDAARSRVSAHGSDLRRLLHYLVEVGVPAAGGPGELCRLRTANHDGDVHLVVEPVNGLSAPSPEPGRPFDPYNEPGSPDGLLERLALDSLLRLVGATLRSYSLQGGKSITVVVWPAVA